MFSRRKSVQPPFEVMRRGSAPLPPPVLNKPPADPAAPHPHSAGWVMAHQPITLRVPPGYAILIALALLALLALAYGAGWAQGSAAAKRQQQALRNAETDIQTSTSLRTIDPPIQPPADASFPPDTRKAGFNYFILARCPKREAAALVDFLTLNQVEATAVSVHNSSLFQVVALRPFRGSEVTGLGSPGERFKQELQRLGRIWKSPTYHGGTDLATTFPELFKDPPSR